MDTSLSGKDTTPAPTVVSLPALDFGLYRAIVANMQAASPDQHERIGRGVEVLLRSRILETDECGVYLVQASQGGDVYYRATSLRCCCPDALQRQLVCKHSHAIAILHAASAIARREQLEARYWLTPKAESALATLDNPAPVPA